MAVKEKVTLTIPEDLMNEVRELAPPRRYSQFVAEAIEYFVEAQRRRILREELIAGYQATAEESLLVTREWEPLDDEAWLLHVPPYEGEEPSDDAPDPTG